MKKPIKPRNDFLEQMRRAQGAKAPAQEKAPVKEKPLEDMSMEELDDALREAKMAQIRAESEALNAKVKAQASGATESTQPTGRRFLPVQPSRHWRT